MPKVPNHYVAIGASAGGLEALEHFFERFPRQQEWLLLLSSICHPTSRA